MPCSDTAVIHPQRRRLRALLYPIRHRRKRSRLNRPLNRRPVDLVRQPGIAARVIGLLDTTGGGSYSDVVLYRPGRAVEKMPLGLADVNEALTIAEHDLKANWRLYRDRYVKERSTHEPRRTR